MDRRIFLAVILTALVIIMTPLIFPNANLASKTDSAAIDSASLSAKQTHPDSTPAPSDKATAATRNTATQPSSAIQAVRDTGPRTLDSVQFPGQRATMWIAAQGGSLQTVFLNDYLSERQDAHNQHVVLAAGPTEGLVRYSARVGNAQIDFSRILFQGELDTVGSATQLTLHGNSDGKSVVISYQKHGTQAAQYVTDVSIEFPNDAQDGVLYLDLPTTLMSAEADTLDDLRHLAFAYRPKHDDVLNIMFAKLDSGATKTVAGPMEWAGVRNKYFFIAALTPDSTISGLAVTGGARVNKIATSAAGRLAIPIHLGKASFQLYTGPQEYDLLKSLGHDLDQVNQYNSFLHAVVQPFASIMTQILLWMKRTSSLSYGWVIIIFGVVVRLLLWPLNQSAMRTTIRMQRLQPELAEVQKKYKSDPRKQQDALMKLYQAHGMTPFSPMMGCLPMLLPMPILFALYFVFLNTIAFRGVSFFWMHDISAADPYFIIPIIMGASMFVLSWIGMRGTPPTPQTRMMSYMMPVVFTFMFFRFSAALNLYYAVQNLAALPQQWMLSNERVALAVPQVPDERKKRE